MSTPLRKEKRIRKPKQNQVGTGLPVTAAVLVLASLNLIAETKNGKCISLPSVITAKMPLCKSSTKPSSSEYVKQVVANKETCSVDICSVSES